MDEQQRSASLARLSTIEGLRGYLALWVVVCHVLWVAGILDHLHEYPAVVQLLGDGGYAVNIFIIVSGFVIFLLLDTKTMSYEQFVLRRYFRLFPLFITLFIVSIPMSRLSMWNAVHASQYLTSEQVTTFSETMRLWWQNLHIHVPLHVVMLHGAAPESLLPGAATAFLVPTWSVSLEWQFYLLAPLAYRMATSPNRYVQLGLLGICALLFVAAQGGLAPDASLPFRIQYFVLGGASYFVYKRRARIRRPNGWFLVMCAISAIILAIRGASWAIPMGLWFAFLGVILEHPSSLTSRLTSLIFTNPVSQRLGQISYSIYLSHILVIAVMQYVLLTWLPTLTLTAHVLMLLSMTFAVTFAVSTGFYRFVEVPGIAWGRSVAQSIAGRRANSRTGGRTLPESATATEG